MAVETNKEKTRAKGEKASQGRCAVCGGKLNAEGQCTICGTFRDAADPKEGKVKANPGTASVEPEKLSVAPRDEAIKTLRDIRGISEAKAKSLYDNGYTSIEALRNADVNKLAAIKGIGDKLAHTIIENANNMINSEGQKQDKALAAWLSSDEDKKEPLGVWLGGDLSDPQTSSAATTEEDSSMEALRKWLTGEEDALEEWLGEPTAVAAPRIEAEGEILERERLLDEREKEILKKEDELEGLRLQTEELRKKIEEELKSIKTGKFDPMKLIEETAELNKNFQTEVRKRKQLEEEIEHLKKGTSAVVKYMKAQLVKGGSPAIKRKIDEEVDKRKKLEIELEKNQKLLGELKEQLGSGLAELPTDKQELKKKELELIEKEADLRAKEEQLEAYEQALKSGELGTSVDVTEQELQNRMRAELQEKERVFLEKEEELKKKIILLEEEIQKHRIEEKLRKESQELRKLDAPQIEEVLARKEKELLAKEKSILLREEEIDRLKEELRFKEDELQKLKEPLSYKEEELLRREEDLLYREKRLAAERRKVEEAKASSLNIEEHEMKERLEALKAEIARKEDEVRAKEKYLKAKMEELRLREQGLIEEEIEAREEERMLEVKQEKVKTGTARLDDLLLGGIPFGSNIQIYGPPFVGKEVIVNCFMAEGLKKGVPCIWVLTDKMPSDIREEMAFVVSGYEEYERLGLVKYVDAYSKSMGEIEEDPHTVYLEDPTDYEALIETVDEVASEFMKEHRYYRLAFRSVSTLVAYLDTTTAFKFLQSFAGRRKRDKSVSMYMLEKGMHGEQEIQMIGSMMDGMIDFKVEQLKSFLSVKGVCDVQSRAWIKYTYSKHGVSIGSFSLDHIR